ncbi:hypothetical protein GBAR_LOCUS28036 [Geodia barretti]|uniref:Uncharacterized protein n=1 Tax=Geodia barretti TaxID=519541 RepID=A0AA35TP22_GEOBA|nr:hypothetical protein GBAR_LOCUS28036 [Geodia barretti]
MVGWSVLLPTFFLKVQKFRPPYSYTLHTPAIVKVFRMVGWSVLLPTFFLKVQKV